MKIGNYDFDTKNKTYVMGILNVTPDSFSDGGKWNSIERAIIHTQKMIDEGAAIIDIGGESTRPGYTKISDEEEIERIVPIISAIRQRFDIPISVDTYKSYVADEALSAGADLVNDIWGLKYDEKMPSVIAKHNCPCCLMHNKNNTEYKNFVDEMIKEMLESVDIALNSGISKENIILDPGIGFGKTYEMNLSAIKNLDKFCSLGYPVLFGCSRKSVIGNTLSLPVDERLEGTLATTVIAVINHCAFVRVHDVKENFRTVKMTEAIYGAENL